MRANRIRHKIHRVSKRIVEQARDGKQAIVMEYVRQINRMYRRGNRQGTAYRSAMTT
jgi:IS605 OrfB family transposase